MHPIARYVMAACTLMLPGVAITQVNWSLSANFVSAKDAGGPHLGLANPVVHDIQEDGKGRMWFATQKGVSRYDGKTFKSYLNTPADSLLWENWGCHFLAADGTGRIWLATTYKLFYFEEKQDKFIEYDLSKVEPDAPHGLGTSEIYLHDWRHEGGVWFFKHSALYYIDPTALAIEKSIKLPRRVGPVGRDRDGLVWDGGWSTREIHLYRTDGKIQQRILAPMGHIEDIFQQPGESIVWIGANTLASYDKATGQWESWSQSEGGSFKGFAVAPSLTNEPILWMYPISKAVLFGFDLKNKRFAYQVSTLELPANPLRCGHIQCLSVDSHGNIWLGGKKGVSVVFAGENEREKWRKLEVNRQNEHSKPLRQLINGTWNMPDGSIAEWMNDGGLYAYIALSKSSKAYFEGQEKDGRTIVGKRIFIHTETGVRTVSNAAYFLNGPNRWYESIEGDSKKYPMAEHPVAKSKIVVCRGKKFDENTDLSGTWRVAEWMNASYFQDGDFAAAIHPEHWAKFHKTGQNTWQGKQVRTYAGCRTETYIRLNTVRPDSIYATWTALDGHCDLYKGRQGSDGVKRYKALSDSDSIFISELRIFNEFQPIVPSEYVSKPYPINHAQNFISFDFTSTADPANCTFYYMLEGFDKDWFFARGQRTATYTNLDGGSYVFKVKAVDVEGNEIRGNARFMLRVKPPFYRTWWFILGAALAFFVLVRFIFRYRLRQQLEKEAIRQRIARDLHDEVGSTLTTISILSESVLRNVELDGEQGRLSGIGEKARSAMSSMSDIVWSVNPQNDSMDKIVERMIRFATDTLEPQGISPVFDVEKAVYALHLPMEQRKDFYLFFKEATTNVAKHSRAGKAVFSMKKENGHLVFELRDDGNGLPETQGKSLGGNGLKNMATRAAALGAEFLINNGIDCGTFVALKIPIK